MAVERLPNIRSTTWRSASQQNVYAGWTASALSDQKLASASRNNGRQPIHPSATTTTSTSTPPIPVSCKICPESVASQALATSGATPRITAGSSSETVRENSSFGRLISTSRLPAIASNDLCFVLAKSSPTSP